MTTTAVTVVALWAQRVIIARHRPPDDAIRPPDDAIDWDFINGRHAPTAASQQRLDAHLRRTLDALHNHLAHATSGIGDDELAARIGGDPIRRIRTIVANDGQATSCAHNATLVQLAAEDIHAALDAGGLAGHLARDLIRDLHVEVAGSDAPRHDTHRPSPPTFRGDDSAGSDSDHDDPALTVVHATRRVASSDPARADSQVVVRVASVAFLNALNDRLRLPPTHVESHIAAVAAAPASALPAIPSPLEQWARRAVRAGGARHDVGGGGALNTEEVGIVHLYRDLLAVAAAKDGTLHTANWDRFPLPFEPPATSLGVRPTTHPRRKARQTRRWRAMFEPEGASESVSDIESDFASDAESELATATEAVPADTPAADAADPFPDTLTCEPAARPTVPCPQAPPTAPATVAHTVAQLPSITPCGQASQTYAVAPESVPPSSRATQPPTVASHDHSSSTTIPLGMQPNGRRARARAARDRHSAATQLLAPIADDDDLCLYTLNPSGGDISPPAVV